MRVVEHEPDNESDGDEGHEGSLEPSSSSGQLSEKGPGARAGPSSSTTRPTPPTSGVNPAVGLRNEGCVTGATAVAHPSRSVAVSPAQPRSLGASEEEILLRAAGRGDDLAFRQLFVRHRGDVARLVFRMLGMGADLDDVVQEVFVQVFRSLRDFRGQSKFSTWLHRVTVNVVLMHRRSARSRPILTEEAPAESVADELAVRPDEDVDRRERMRAFQRLLDRLADKKRIVFVLHDLEGLAPSEIANIVRAPVLTVRTRLFYARRELEAMLHDEPALASLCATFAKRGERDA